MTFRMKGLNKQIKIKGEIAHTSRLGIGIKFKAINPQKAKRLQILVDQMKKNFQYLIGTNGELLVPPLDTEAWDALNQSPTCFDVYGKGNLILVRY